MIEKYRDLNFEELAADPYFQEWVLNPTKEHHSFWNRFLEKFPEKEGLVKEAKTLVSTVHKYFGKEEIHAGQLDEYFEEVLRRSEKPERSIRKPLPAKLKKLVIRGAVAASILLAAVFGWIWFGPSNSMQTIVSGYGEWKTLELPDGSQVELNANSEIKFARSWKEGADRKVWLEGEAFFKVETKPATGAKFQVITKDLMVEVLGTSFNVNSRGAHTDVFLEEGSIRLDLGEMEEVMKPGEFIAYSAEKKTVLERRKEASAEAHTSWKDGVLILKDKKVAEILAKIEETYGVKIKVENEALLTVEKTISIPMDKLEIAIPILEGVLQVEITKEENLLLIQ